MLWIINQQQTPDSQLGFGASGAVARLKVCANLQVMLPSERQWKPRLRQALARYVPYADSAVQLGSEKIRSNKVESSVQFDKLDKNGELQKRVYKE